MLLLRQSTATTVKSHAVLDNADLSAETSQTIQKADVRISKNSGNMIPTSSDQGASDAGAAHDEVGKYDISLNTTDTNTLGALDLVIAKSGTLPVEMHFMVLPANVYDSLVLGTDALDVSLIQWLGTAPLALTSQRVEVLVGAMAANTITATAIASDAITAAKIASDALTAAKFAADCLTAAKFAADVTTEFQNGLATAAALATLETYVDTEVAAIKAKTDNLPSDPADQSAVEAAITAAVADLIAENADLFDFGIMNSTTIATLASQTSFTLTDGSANDNAYNGRVAVVKDSATDLQRAVLKILDYTGSTKTITLAEDPAIFTMAVGDYITITSVPYSSGGSGATAAEVRAEMDANSTKLASIDTATGTTIPATLATMDGKLDTIDNLLDTEIGSIITSLGTIAGYLDTEIAAILADTNELQLDWQNGGRLDLLIDGITTLATAIKATTDLLPDSGALSSLATAALFTSTTRNDPAALSGALAAGLTPLAKLDWILARVMRENSFNKTTGEEIVENSSGTPIAKATAADDGTTTTRGAFGAP